MEIYVRNSSKEGRGRRTAAAGPAMLKASRSTREGRRTMPAAAMPRSLSSRSCGGGVLGKEEEEERAAAAAPRSFSSRCAGLVKEQRARFYIVRRCVTMLICWRDYS